MSETTSGSAPASRAPSSDVAQSSSEALFASDHFRMFAYKILPCAKRTSHEWTTCPFAHPGEKARRRDPRVYNYLAIPCEDTKQGGVCPRGDDCPRSHSLFEFWLHPSRYRTQLCRDNDGAQCKRQVCFFAHSIEELRVPDHSHLNIPPEMLKQAAASGANSSNTDSSSQTSADDDVSSTSSSTSSTPRDTDLKKDSGNSKPATAKPLAPCTSNSRAVNITGTGASHGYKKHHKVPRASHSSAGSLLQSPLPSSHPWAGFAGTPAASGLVGSGSSSPADFLASSLLAAATLEQRQQQQQQQQQRAMLQLRQAQLQSPHVLSPAGSLYEQQLQMLLAAESAHAQQAQQAAQLQQLLAMQQQNQQSAAAAWGCAAALSNASLGSYGDACGFQGGSPPLSPMPGGILDAAAGSVGQDTTPSYFVPPSASCNALSALTAAGSRSWPASALRTLSMPSSAGLVRSASGIPMPPSSAVLSRHNSSAAAQQAMHSSGMSSVCDVQDMTLASLLGCSGGDGGGWVGGPAAGGSPPGGSVGCEGLGLGMGYSAGRQGVGAGVGSLMGGNVGLEAAQLMLLQEQQRLQMQQKGSMGAAGHDLMQGFTRADMGGCMGQTGEEVLGLMMQQLLLQQSPVVM